MATLIEKITTRVFDEKQMNFFNIIRGNFKISKHQIAELKKKNKNNNELRQNIEHAKNVLEEGVARMKRI